MTKYQRNIFAKYTSYKELVFRIYKPYLNNKTTEQ